MNIGIIPSRLDSKRFPGKGWALLGGIPLWKRAVQLSQKHMDRSIVSTDDMKIIEDDSFLFEYFIRPEHLTDGLSYRIDDVMLYMIPKCGFKDKDILYLFQPTNTFISNLTIEKAIYGFDKYPEIESAQSVYEVNNIYHAYSQRVFKDGWVNFAFPELRNKYPHYQQKPNHYVFAGLIACRVKALLENQNIWGTRSLGIVASDIETIDIDTEEDLKYAESLIAAGVAV